jgi:hypothetical protein
MELYSDYGVSKMQTARLKAEIEIGLFLLVVQNEAKYQIKVPAWYGESDHDGDDVAPP